MNDFYWLQLRTRWNDFGGQIKDRWGDITDADLERIGGSPEMLVELLQERYDKSREEAEVNEWLGNVFE